jgi:hypothetical protein
MKQESFRQSLPSNHRGDGPPRNARIQQLAKECKSRNPPVTALTSMQHSLPGEVIGACLPRSEVSPHCLESNDLLVNLRGRSYAQSAKNRHWRAPSLEGVLKEKACDYRRQREPAAVYRRAQSQSNQGNACSIRLEHSLDVPLALELGNARRDLRSIGIFVTPQTPEHRLADTIVRFGRGVLRDSCVSRRQYRRHDADPMRVDTVKRRSLDLVPSTALACCMRVHDRREGEGLADNRITHAAPQAPAHPFTDKP